MIDCGPDRREHRWTTRLRRGLPDQGNRISGALAHGRRVIGPEGSARTEMAATWLPYADFNDHADDGGFTNYEL
jgi:hypothetical protein